MDETTDSAVRRVIDAVGGIAALAAKLGIKAPSIYSWKRIPTDRVLAIEAATGIPRYELRPDIHPPPIAQE